MTNLIIKTTDISCRWFFLAFLKLFFESTVGEKEELFAYIISKGKDKKTKDCIAHKFIGGGAYTTTTFVDDLKVLYFTDYILNNKFNNFEEFIGSLLKKYFERFYSVSEEKLINFIKNHRSIFKGIYKSIYAIDLR